MNRFKSKSYLAKIKLFFPLIIIFAVIIVFTIISQFYRGYRLMDAMSDFMGFFFLVFGIFKIVNLHKFAEAYQMYDIIAKRSIIYAYVYPFIEITLGLAYLFRWNLVATNIITLVIMSISAVGVAQELLAGKKFVCACLGAVFKIPMTWVTLIEDLSMALMALIMLILK